MTVMAKTPPTIIKGGLNRWPKRAGADKADVILKPDPSLGRHRARGRYFLNENHSVMVNGTSIQPSSKMVAGAIINRAMDRECWVAIGKSFTGQTSGLVNIY
jgi:hypothetical protein